MAHSIGKTIAELRKAKGWTQIELAKKLNVSDKAVSKWESEGGFPEITQLPVLAKIFDVSIDYLMTGKKTEPEVITMSKIELCAKNDDVSMVKNIDLATKDENGKTLIDYIIEYKSYNIFAAICDEKSFVKLQGSNDRRIKKFDVLTLIEFALITNKISVLDRDFVLNINYAVEDIKGLIHVDELNHFKNFQVNGAKHACLITNDILDVIVRDKRINQGTILYLLSKQKKRDCVWYLVLPYLLHQSYLHNNIELFNMVLKAAIENNQYAYEKMVLAYDSYYGYNYELGYFILAGKTHGAKPHGLVRVLEKTIKLALERGDIETVEKFNNVNIALMKYSTYFKCYVASEEEIKMSKFKNGMDTNGDKTALSIIEYAVQDDIINLQRLKKAVTQIAVESVGNSDKVKCIQKLIQLVKQFVPNILSGTAISYYELLVSWINKKNFKAVFEFAVNYGFTDLANELMEANSDKIETIVKEKFLFTEVELQPYKEICEKIISKNAQYPNMSPTWDYFSQLEKSKQGIYERILSNKFKKKGASDSAEIYKKLLLQQLENITLENLNTQNANLAYFKDEKTAFYNNWLKSLEDEYEEITHAKAMAEAHQKVMSEITKEYLLDLLNQENKEVLVIKLCVKLESILRNRFHYDGELNEMINSLHSVKVTHQEDDGWGYMIDKEVEKYPSEMFEDFYKLRVARNSIVHASIGGVEIEMNVLKRCINWIESL